MVVDFILCRVALRCQRAMTDDSQLTFSLPSVSRKKVTAAFDGGHAPRNPGRKVLELAKRKNAVIELGRPRSRVRRLGFRALAAGHRLDARSLSSTTSSPSSPS
jgi:hypothetical protein